MEIHPIIMALELSNTEKEPQVYTVSELTHKVRILLESGLGSVWVSGEISNFRRPHGEHLYFTLKDDNSQINSVMF